MKVEPAAPSLLRDPAIRPVFITAKSFYIILWVLTPLVSALASRYTFYPNQIYAIYELISMCMGAVALKNIVTIVRLQIGWLSLLILYCITFVVVSYYGVSFATSVHYGVFYQPLILLEFFIAFSIGYAFPEQRTFRYLKAMGFVLIVYMLIDIVVSPGETRVITTLNIPMTIPLYVFSVGYFSALVAVVATLLSLKKTIAVIGLFSFSMAFALRRYVDPDKPLLNRFYKKRHFIAGFITVLILLIAVVGMLVGFSSYMSGTFARFLEDEDTSRTSITAYSLLLLLENFPHGIGWLGFLYLSADVIPYEVTNVDGDVIPGVNLHSSYMTWALEGGGAIVVIMLIFFGKLFRVVWSFLRRESTRFLGATLLIWVLSGMIFGSFQQWHSSGTFWSLLGFAFGCCQRYKAYR